MSRPGIKSVEGSSVDAPCHATHGEGTPPTCQDDTLRVKTPIEMGGLTDCLSRVLVEDPQGRAPEGPMLGMRHKVNELDVELLQHFYCLQLDVALSQDLSRPPPPQSSWTTDTIWDMVTRDAPNVKDCVILGPGLAVLFLVAHRSPKKGFTCMRLRN